MTPSITESVAKELAEIDRPNRQECHRGIEAMRDYVATKAVGAKADDSTIKALKLALNKLPMIDLAAIPRYVELKRRADLDQHFLDTFDARCAALEKQRSGAQQAVHDARERLGRAIGTLRNIDSEINTIGVTRGDCLSRRAACPLLFGSIDEAMDFLFPPKVDAHARLLANNPNNQNWRQEKPPVAKKPAKPLPKMPHPNNPIWANKGTPGAATMGAV